MKNIKNVTKEYWQPFIYSSLTKALFHKVHSRASVWTSIVMHIYSHRVNMYVSVHVAIIQICFSLNEKMHMQFKKKKRSRSKKYEMKLSCWEHTHWIHTLFMCVCMWMYLCMSLFERHWCMLRINSQSIPVCVD